MSDRWYLEKDGQQVTVMDYNPWKRDRLIAAGWVMKEEVKPEKKKAKDAPVKRESSKS